MIDPFSKIPPPLAERLEKEDAEARKGATIYGPILAAIGLGFAVWLFSYAARHGRALSPRGEELIPMLIGLAIFALGIRWFLSRKKPDPRIASLTNAEVIWLYVQELSRSGTSTTLCIGTSTGELVKFHVARTQSPYEEQLSKVRREAEDLLRQIAPHYPKAAIGHTPENQAAFQKVQKT